MDTKLRGPSTGYHDAISAFIGRNGFAFLIFKEMWVNDFFDPQVALMGALHTYIHKWPLQLFSQDY